MEVLSVTIALAYDICCCLVAKLFKAFSDAILVNQLCGDVKSEESAVHDTLPFINIPLHSEPKPERVTKYIAA